MAVGYVGVIAHEGGGFDVMGLAAIGMQFLEMALFLAFAIFVSTFSSSLLSIVYTSGVFFAGHIVSQILTDAKAIGIAGWKLQLVRVLYYVFPNLEKFDIRNFAVHQVAMPFASFALALCYAVVYVALLLSAAVWIFEKKEI
jgi:ABC-type transport system involved in multi-copper enzyme maturation permease subunit